jgi:hypothetical protein
MYTHGTDRQYRPVIYINMAFTNFHKVLLLIMQYTMNDYYCALNHLLKPVIDGMFVPGKVENWIIVIDTEGKLLLPLHMVECIVRKLSVIYCGRLEKMYIVNANILFKLGYKVVKQFITSNT